MAGSNTKIAAAILGVLLSLGIAGAGYFVSTTVYKGRMAANTATVKGLAERDVKADLALWRIGYSITGGRLADVYARAKTDEETLGKFLTDKGIPAADIKSGNLNVTDVMANAYRSRDVSPNERYIVANNISVRSTDVELVERLNREMNDLIRQGIVLTSNNVDYQFTKLNGIKSAMMREATENARDAAQQFADDAGSKVGSIQSASQGFFSIMSLDAAVRSNDSDPNYSGADAQRSTIDKKVRVVVTLTYYLER